MIWEVVMKKKQFLSAERASLLLLSFLWLLQASSTTAGPSVSIDPENGAATSVEIRVLNAATTTVSGTVYYKGLSSGTHMLGVGLLTGEAPFKLILPPAAGTDVTASAAELEAGKPYTIENVPAGTYYPGAFWDINDSDENEDTEPSGLYSYTDAVTIGGSPLTGIDITLEDHLLMLKGDYSPPRIGQPFNFIVRVQPIDTPFDAWGVIIAPDGTLYSFVLADPGSLYKGLKPLAEGVPGLGTAYERYLFTTAAIPAGAAGDYTVIVGLVPAGVTPTGVESAIPGYVIELPLRVR